MPGWQAYSIPVTGSPAPAGPDREEELDAGSAKLHLEHFLPPTRPLGVLLAVHGYGVHCGLYRHVGATLARAGWAVTQFDCRGHGRSSGRRGHVARFDQYSDDLVAVAARARTLAPAGPLVLVGHSHGGTIAVDSVLRGRITPDRLVLAAPYLGLTMPVPPVKRAIAPIMARLWPTLTMANGIRSVDLSRNPELVTLMDTDPLVHHVATARWFQEAVAAHARILAGAAALRVPTLLLVVGEDRIVSTAAALAFAEAAGRAVAVRRYEGVYHELFWEPEKDRILADVVAWLRAPVTDGADLGRAPGAVPGII
jgi:alpha-beta hydrolase superfamily lysophospholipase